MVERVWVGWGARANVVSGTAGGERDVRGAGRERCTIGCRRGTFGGVWEMAARAGWWDAGRNEGCGGGDHDGGGREVRRWPDVYGWREGKITGGRDGGGAGRRGKARRCGQVWWRQGWGELRGLAV